MKIISLIRLIAVLFPLFSVAQEEKDTTVGFKNISVGLGVGMGQEIAVNLFTTVNFKKGLYLGFQYLATSARSKEVPDGYVRKPGLFSSSTRTQRDHFEAYSFLIGQHFPIKKSRFTISAETGLSILNYSFARFKANPYGTGGTFTGYELHRNAGWLVNGRLGYQLRQNMNLELSTYACINPNRNIVVENLSLVFDSLVKQKKHKKAIAGK